jgi:enamine deaminase RidA (YjgF/YER057c/UK114 family)
MSTPEQRLVELGITLPAASKPAGNYTNGVRVGNLLFMSGCGPQKPGGGYVTGKLGKTLTIEQGYEAARFTGLTLLANIRGEVGSLDKVVRVVKTLGMINADPEFNDTPKVINGCSDLFVEVFGEAGRGARSAVGMATLPFQIAVEVEMVLEVRD